MSVESEGCRWRVKGVGGESGVSVESEGCPLRVRGVG